MATTSARLLSLLSLLQSRRDWPGGHLAERLDVSERTVRRDVDRLRELGYPIRAAKGPDGGYRLEAGSELPPLLFDDEQAVALAVALRLATGSGAGIEEAAARALATVRQVMPARLRGRIDALRVTTADRPGPRVDADVLVALSDAVRAGVELRFDYGSDPSAAPRRAEAHHLVARGGRWYLVAFDLDRAGWRTFRADRVRPRVPTGPRFAPRELPGGDAAAFVESVFRGGDGTSGWPCTGEVILDVPAREVTPYVVDGVVEDLDGDRCRLVLGAWSWAGLAATIGRLDTEVVVVAPPELREAFAALAERFARTASTPPPVSARSQRR